MKTIYILISAVLLVSSSLADDILVTEEYGFSIQPPIAKKIDAYPYTMAMFFLPPSNEFSANVNVQKQAFNQSLEAYDKISMNQFKQLNASILQQKIQDNEILYEAKANASGKSLHFYSRAVQREGFIYLITATSLESQWEQQKAELMKSVNSFKLTK